MTKTHNQNVKIPLPNFKLPIGTNSFFKNGIDWQNIPQLAVITGINGSGKTRLIDEIFKKVRDSKGFPHVFYKNNSNQNIFLQPVRKDQLEENTNEDSFHFVKQNVINQIKNNRHIPNIKNELKKGKPEVRDWIEFIEKKYGKDVTEFNDVECRDVVKDYYPKQLRRNIQYPQLERSIMIFCYHLQKINLDLFNQLTNDLISQEEVRSKLSERLKAIFGTDISPWEMINNKLSHYGFKHSLIEPSYSFNEYKVEFKNSDEIIIDFNSLSSGEKVIFQLILWSYDEANNGNKLLLIDEFDAHLNPSMAKMYVEIVEDVLIKQFQMQVIMTTHSASTVAYCKEESLFWMEEGQIGKRDKKFILKALTPGLILLEDNASLMGDLARHIQENKYILFVEGKSDKIYFEKAIELFYPKKDEIFVLACSGVETIKTFVEIAKQIIKDKSCNRFLAIVDDDTKGRGEIKAIESKGCACIKIIIPDIHKDSANLFREDKLNYAIEFLLEGPFFKNGELNSLGRNLFMKENNSNNNLFKMNGENEQQITNLKQVQDCNPFLLYILKPDTDENRSKKVEVAKQIGEKGNKNIFENFLPTINLIKEKIETTLTSN